MREDDSGRGEESVPQHVREGDDPVREIEDPHNEGGERIRKITVVDIEIQSARFVVDACEEGMCPVE